MNRLSTEKRTVILNMLVEGSSMRSISRVTGVSINTVSKLLVAAGEVCSQYHDQKVRNVTAGNVQADEVWSFTYSKEKNAPRAKGVIDHAGDVWLWKALDRDSKLIVSWHVGGRTVEDALEFTDDLQARITNRVQLTTDGLGAYKVAVDESFGGQIDYAQVIKVYGPDLEVPKTQRRYSAPQCVRVTKQAIQGNPDMDRASTSHVERANLTTRMSVRRYTRLTNAFSKKLANHKAAVSLYFHFYNFARPHSSLGGKTPAQAAGLARYKKDMASVVKMIDDAAPAPKRPKTYKKKS